MPNCIFSGIISIFAKAFCTASAPPPQPAAQRRRQAEQCRQQRQSCNGLISPKATQIFSKAVQFFGKVNHDTWEKFIPLRDSLFHSRNNLPSTKRFHRKMLKTCMSFLLEFVYCAFLFLYIVRNPTNSTNHQVCCTLCILVMEFKD